VCFKTQLIIEVHGGHHAFQKEKDLKRTAWLKQEGFQVIRFWNNDVLENIEGVLDSIRDTLNNLSL
jgi:very-short-patch-repair endonuclease